MYKYQETILPKGQHYSRVNPPPSLEIAIARRDELEHIEQHIGAKADFRTPDDFTSDEEYDAWKRRAVAAIAYFRTELRFLDRWIKQRTPCDQQKDQKNREAVERLRNHVQKARDMLASSYTPVFSACSLPQDAVLAEARMQELVELIRRFNAFFAAFKEEAKNIVSQPEMIDLRRPLTTIYQQIMAERSIVVHYVNKHNIPRPEQWMTFLLDLVERGIREGVILTSEEQAFLQEICEYQTEKQKRLGKKISNGVLQAVL